MTGLCNECTLYVSTKILVHLKKSWLEKSKFCANQGSAGTSLLASSFCPWHFPSNRLRASNLKYSYSVETQYPGRQQRGLLFEAAGKLEDAYVLLALMARTSQRNFRRILSPNFQKKKSSNCISRESLCRGQYKIRLMSGWLYEYWYGKWVAHWEAVRWKDTRWPTPFLPLSFFVSCSVLLPRSQWPSQSKKDHGAENTKGCELEPSLGNSDTQAVKNGSLADHISCSHCKLCGLLSRFIFKVATRLHIHNRSAMNVQFHLSL